jgi:hypothetical protein
MVIKINKKDQYFNHSSGLGSSCGMFLSVSIFREQDHRQQRYSINLSIFFLVSLFKGDSLGRTLVKIGPYTLNSD